MGLNDAFTLINSRRSHMNQTKTRVNSIEALPNRRKFVRNRFRVEFLFYTVFCYCYFRSLSFPCFNIALRNKLTKNQVKIKYSVHKKKKKIKNKGKKKIAFKKKKKKKKKKS